MRGSVRHQGSVASALTAAGSHSDLDRVQTLGGETCRTLRRQTDRHDVPSGRAELVSLIAVFASAQWHGRYCPHRAGLHSRPLSEYRPDRFPGRSQDPLSGTTWISDLVWPCPQVCCPSKSLTSVCKTDYADPSLVSSAHSAVYWTRVDRAIEPPTSTSMGIGKQVAISPVPLLAPLRHFATRRSAVARQALLRVPVAGLRSRMAELANPCFAQSIRPLASGLGADGQNGGSRSVLLAR